MKNLIATALIALSLTSCLPPTVNQVLNTAPSSDLLDSMPDIKSDINRPFFDDVD